MGIYIEVNVSWNFVLRKFMANRDQFGGDRYIGGDQYIYGHEATYMRIDADGDAPRNAIGCKSAGKYGQPAA
jgi:hypothetical protein